MQFLLMFVVIIGGTAGVIASQHRQPATKDTSTHRPTNETDTKAALPKEDIIPQDNTQQSTSSQNSTNPTGTNDLGSTLDQYGCATNTPSYSQCVKNAKALWCDTQVSAPSSVFNSATLQARTAYNTVMNEWEVMQYKTVHSPKSEYLADASNKFNTLYEPAFSTYTTEVQSLNSQGCSIAYPVHESPGQYL
ncbi:MAG: hypothetical protein WBP22_02555 [Candidatus Saccharimonas sp.]